MDRVHGILRATRAAIAMGVFALAPGLGCTPDAPPPLEPFEVEATIPLPPNVVTPSLTGTGQSQAFGGRLTPDDAHVVVQIKDASDRDQQALIDLDGANLQCVTCGIYTRATALEVFPDGQRALVNVTPGQGGGLGDVQLAVLECTPSVYDCQTRVSLPLRFPIPSLAAGAQNRGVQLHPDGQHIKWNEVRTLDGEIMTIGRLERHETEYQVVPLAVLNPDYELTSGPEGWVDGGRYYELGEWVDGGRAIKYGTTTTAGNYDSWEVDLTSGVRRQLTTDLDYNELYDASPDGEWLAYASPRGLDRMDVFSQLVRPPFLEVVSFVQIGRVGLWNNRRCMNERWLMDRKGQRGSYGGQPIVVEDGWAIRSWSWFPDGTRALVAQERIPNEPEPSVPYDRARLQILRFPAREATTPLPVVSLADIDLSWAVPYGAYESMASRAITDQVVQGRVSGQAILNYTGNFTSGFASVEYQDYSDDGLSFVNGVESVDTPLQTVNSTWSAELTISGALEGYLSGELNVNGPGNFSGFIESDVNGSFFDAVPVQADCPGIHQPPLVIEAVQTQPLPADQLSIWVRVTAQLPEDPVRRDVEMATVAIGPASAQTERNGWARLTVPVAEATSVTVSAGGFLTAIGPIP